MTKMYFSAKYHTFRIDTTKCLKKEKINQFNFGQRAPLNVDMMQQWYFFCFLNGHTGYRKVS